MALNTSICNLLTSLRFKGLTPAQWARYRLRRRIWIFMKRDLSAGTDAHLYVRSERSCKARATINCVASAVHQHLLDWLRDMITVAVRLHVSLLNARSMKVSQTQSSTSSPATWTEIRFSRITNRLYSWRHHVRVMFRTILTRSTVILACLPYDN